jgi:hypothetical protein
MTVIMSRQHSQQRDNKFTGNAMGKMKTCLLVLLMFVTAGLWGIVRAEDRRLLLDLRGKWRFQLGDNVRWSDPAFEDSKWDQIFVPSPWEDEGFPGYDGYAWYRKHFQAAPEWKGKTLLIDLGNVDDVDEVYLNGRFIGFSGSFPPQYYTAYDVSRRYPVLDSYLNFSGDNVIAVRVFDAEQAGGIIRGRVGIYEDRSAPSPQVSLVGNWKFTTGDNMRWKDVDFDDSHWKNVTVPAAWETQGFRDYDGYGWYRTTFRIPSSIAHQQLVMLLGKIDDLDETFLNGERIGRTGSFPSNKLPVPAGDEWLQVRAYTIPPGLLRQNAENVLAVRVYDAMLQGGIYDGPIGIVSRKQYSQWEETVRRNFEDGWKFFDKLFK